MDDIFKALSDTTRREILSLLRQKDMTVGEIAVHFAITGATLSHHLDILKRARLVIAERNGQFIMYSLNTSVFEESVKMILNIFKKGSHEKI
jgi:DNA-binding transcriptional ArsR family regulator